MWLRDMFGDPSFHSGYRKRYEADGVSGLLAYGWIKKGQDKVVKSNSGRQRININGALNADTLEVIIRTDDTINTQSTLKLFETLEQKYPNAEAIFITLDNAKYYKNGLVYEYLKTSKIKLLFMPPYSPNLNPIERLWKIMHESVTYNKYYESFSDFSEATVDFFRNIGRNKSILRSRITDNFQILHSPLLAS